MTRRREALMGYLFALPWLIGGLVFLVYPLLASVYYSFCDYSVLKKPMLIGFDNYKEILSDKVFWQVTYNTLVYAVIFLPLSSIFAFGLAVLLNSKVRGIAVYRTLFFLPALVPVVPTAVLWFWIFNGQHGILNTALAGIHIKGPDWLGSPAFTKLAIVLLGIWGVGNTMLIYLASLQDVPTSLIEASELDGATPLQKTWNITLPMISPVILFNLIMGLIGSLQVFAVPYVMWPLGSPERSAYFYSMYLFDNAFKFNKMGYACAMGWIMFIVILILTLVLLKLSERRVHYQGS
jgi:multiple sugar transport system permease protein